MNSDLTITICEHHSLRKHNTLALEQSTRYFVEVRGVHELQQALAFAKKNQIPVLVLGDGSNIVFSRDYPGLIIKNAIKGIRVVEEAGSYVVLEIGAGENWHALICHALRNQWHGLENLALIPGTAGAAPVQNIGAYGVELQDVFVSAQVLDKTTSLTQVFDKATCAFSYRDSIFKQQPGRFIIASISLKLSRQPNVNIRYQALKEYFEKIKIDSPTPQQLFDAVVDIRSSRLPDPAVLPNVGSFFKNPLVTLEHFQELLKSHPHIVSYPTQDSRQMKLAAAWLIDQAGWKGVREGNVAVHNKQALVLVNCGGATGQELLGFAAKIRDDIRRRYDVELEFEPTVI